MLSRRLLLLFHLVAVVAVAGCLVRPRDTVCAERPPLGREIWTYQAPSKPDSAEAPLSAPAEHEGELMLQDALALALLHSPRLAGVSWDVRIGEARTLQARFFPNPEVEVEVDGAPGSGKLGDFKTDETTIWLSQLVELGGKRSARRRLAAMEVALADWSYEIERLTILTDTRLGFIDVLAAQERLRLAEDLLRLSEQIFEVVTERVKAGKVSPLESSKASVELAKSKIELEKATGDLRAARKRLAAAWGSTSPRFSRARGVLRDVAQIPPFDVTQLVVQRNLEVVRWTQETEQRLAALALEKTKRVPDAVLSVGARRFRPGGDRAFTFGLSLEIPLFDRNQGGVLEARYRLAKAAYDKRDVELRTATALTEAYEELTAAGSEAFALKREVLPAASQALSAAREGYQLGRFDYIDVLDAQRTFFRTEAELIDALSRYHSAVAIVEGLVGTDFDSQNKAHREKGGKDNDQ